MCVFFFILAETQNMKQNREEIRNSVSQTQLLSTNELSADTFLLGGVLKLKTTTHKLLSQQRWADLKTILEMGENLFELYEGSILFYSRCSTVQI